MYGLPGKATEYGRITIARNTPNAAYLCIVSVHIVTHKNAMRSLRQQPPQAANEILSHRASAPKLHEHRRKQPTHAHHQRRIATVSASQEQVVR